MLPVSYTHLDVYKRQVQVSDVSSAYVEKRLASTHTMPFSRSTEAGCSTSTPVSYTHLDVYKRQAQDAFAPSHTMPATMESAFTTAWHASL